MIGHGPLPGPKGVGLAASAQTNIRAAQTSISFPEGDGLPGSCVRHLPGWHHPPRVWVRKKLTKTHQRSGQGSDWSRAISTRGAKFERAPRGANFLFKRLGSRIETKQAGAVSSWAWPRRETQLVAFTLWTKMTKPSGYHFAMSIEKKRGSSPTPNIKISVANATKLSKKPGPIQSCGTKRFSSTRRNLKMPGSI